MAGVATASHKLDGGFSQAASLRVTALGFLDDIDNRKLATHLQETGQVAGTDGVLASLQKLKFGR
jgi:hypothetical protein